MSLQRIKLASVGILSLLIVCRSAAGQAPAPVPVKPLVVENAAPFTPSIVRFSPDSAARLAKLGRDSAASVQLSPGLRLSLWAPEGLISDPIGIGFDDRGRLFVTRTSRTSRDEIDIRGHSDWMMASIGFKDVEDKRKFYQTMLAPERSAQNTWLKDWNGDGSRDWRDLTFHKEGLYRVEDTNGDGIADYSQHILQDFNDLVSDVAHGVMWYRNDLYLTLSPDIWRLRDTNGDGVIDTKESLAHGSGIHIGFGGHGLSGPLIGPDGRLYWKQGDLGVNIKTRDGRTLYNPNSGVIMRANPDGTEAEIFANGLRNPQEFAFDEYGNLISPDNDGDHPGERERLVYVVDGMDSGWRINWQFGKYVDPDNNTYKVWMEENLFKPRFAGQAAYITPPIAPWHDGPSGFDYNPGTALSDAWKGHFFSAVFTGAPAIASIQGFTLVPQGAGFKLGEDKSVESGILATGVKFGPDGALYVADWVEGWDPKDRGRIWKIDVPGGASTPARLEVKALIAASFKDKSVAELSALLRHADMRIRTKAQFELVERGAVADLLASARETTHQLARVHGLWGIAQLARKDTAHAASLVPFLKDADPEIRAQAAKLIGDVRYGTPAADLVAMLRDTAPRPRFFAAEALGRIKYRPAIQPIIDMLAANDDQDVYLRTAGVIALSRIGVAEPIVALANHPSRGVRLAAVVTLRRMRDPGVAQFLHDADELVVTEAARAINDDGGIAGALPALAAILDGPFTNEPLMRRVLSANLRVGTEEAARRVAAFAGRSTSNEKMRIEAISELGVWPKPSVLDRVDGTNIGEAQQRDSSVARAALTTLVEPLFADASTPVQVALADAIGRLGLSSASATLVAKVTGATAPAVRVAALRALAKLGDAKTEEALRAALQDQDVTVRMAAISAIPPLKLPEATTTDLLSSVVGGTGTVAERQSALTSLGQIPGTTSRATLSKLVDQLAQNKVAPEIQLDVAEAARATKDSALVARLNRLERSRARAAPLVAYGNVLRGGDARRGQRIVMQGPSAECVKCHNLGTGAGANVGPSLRGVAGRLTRAQILESLVDPSARIAPGFGPVMVTLKDGKKAFGTLKEETATYIIVDAGTPKRILKSDIAKRANGPSAMPPMGPRLTRRELRDVVEYLSSLK
jgi:putative heme-binding domain-containing protein